MMRTVLFIHGGKVTDELPIAHFLLRLQAAVDYYHRRRAQEEITFIVSGRWTSVTEPFTLTEAEVGKRWILQQFPDARVLKEDISVELIGNYAFSKPLVTALTPDTVIIFTSVLLQTRSEAIASRIFGSDVPYEFDLITADQSENDVLVEREVLATQLFTDLFASIATGDDAAFRTTLLYQTPYYFKMIIDDKEFFDRYWAGGFEHYLHGRDVRHKLG